MLKFCHLGFMALSYLLLLGCSGQSVSIDTTDENIVHKFETYSAEEFFQTTTIFGSSINANTTAVLVSNDETGVFNVYKQPLDGSKAIQLTSSTVDSTYGVSWFPNDDRFLYTADQGGNELNHLFVKQLDDLDVDLTPGENLKAYFAGWHQDEKSFYVATNERDEKYFDLYQYQVSDYERRLVFTNTNGYSVESISPNGAWLVMSKSMGNANSDLYMVNLLIENDTPSLITEHTGDIEHGVYTFSKDNKTLIFSTNEHGEYREAWSYNVEKQTSAMYYQADWDVSFIYFSKDGRYQVSGVNADAQTAIKIYDTKLEEEVLLPSMPKGDLQGVNFSADSSTMVFYINSDTAPSNLYTHKLGTNSVNRLTNTGNPNIAEEKLVNGEVIRFKSFDGLEIPAILYKPKQASYRKVPALIYIHGGPGGQSRKGYSALTQHLVNNGYAIIKINNRGSSGYGKTFFHLDDKRHGEDDLQDVVFNKKYLQTLDWVDKDRIGVIGGSYGGYLTMAAMTFTDEFKVGINIFGVTNWVRTLESIPPYWEAFRKSLYDELGDPATDKERLHNISPVFFGHQVKSPVLVVQGENDPRVLKIESDEMVEAIRAGGTFVDYLVFDDEGHGFRKKVNRINASEKYIEFLGNHL